MSNWSGFVLTKKGQQLLAKVEAGETLLNITKMKTGDGVLPVGQALEDLTDLVSPKQLVGITTKEALTGETGEYTGETRVSGTLANNELEAGYSFKEWGIFADDPDSEKDILYAISIDSAPDYIPPKGSVGISQKLSARIVISNAASITIVVDMNAMATMKDLTTSINNHNTAADAHADIRQAIEDIDVSEDINKHNTAADAHADIRQAIEDIDVSQDIQKHNTDSTAHADKFTQYLPLTGGNITGALSLNDKFVAVSVNGQKADAEGNIDMSGSEGTQLYTSAGSYTWTVPDGISKVLVTASAGGGGGGYGCRTSSRDGYFEYGGYGGRGANCYKYEIAVTAGEEISIVIGNGGGPASAGGATSFGDKLTLSGGGAGGNSSGEGHPGANAGAASPQSIFTSCPYSAYGAGGNRGGSGGATDISPGAGSRGMMLLEWSWLS